MIKSLEIKVIEAAQTLQQQLASSAEQPAIAAQELNEQTQNRLLNTIDGSSCRHLPQLPGFKPCPPARHYSRHLRQPPVFEHCLLSPKRICRHWGQVLAGIGNSYPRDGKDEAGVGHIYPREETGEGKGEAEEMPTGVGPIYPRDGDDEEDGAAESRLPQRRRRSWTSALTHRWFQESVQDGDGEDGVRAEEKSLSLSPLPRRRTREEQETASAQKRRRLQHRK